MPTVRTALLLGTLAVLGVGAARALVGDGAAGDGAAADAAPAGDGLRSVMDAAALAALGGFRPAACAADETPPAELLALAAWPLDDAGTCAARTRVAEGAASDPLAAAGAAAVLGPVPALAEVVEAQIRAPQQVLDSYGDAPVTAPSAQADYGEHAGLAPAADPSAYGDADPQQVALATQFRRVPHEQRPPAPGRPLRPTLFAAAAADDATLDRLRGGFETPSGLRVSFGIERAVYVNGVLASVTTVNLAELGNLVGRGGSAPVALTEGATVAVIQNGPNNGFAAAQMSAGALATVIQNSLDNQNVRAVTTINATVNSMEMLRGTRMMQSVRDGMVHSLMR